MKTRMVTRITAQYPGQTGVWFGTCAKWARDLPTTATVKRERVMVVNPTPEPCNYHCGNTHIRVPAPS